MKKIIISIIYILLVLGNVYADCNYDIIPLNEESLSDSYTGQTPYPRIYTGENVDGVGTWGLEEPLPAPHDYVFVSQISYGGNSYYNETGWGQVYASYGNYKYDTNCEPCPDQETHTCCDHWVMKIYWDDVTDSSTTDSDGDGVMDDLDCDAHHEPPAVTDTDGDGLNDDVDPFPNSTANFVYKKVGEYLDGSDQVTGTMYQAYDTATGETSYITLGSPGDNDDFWAIIGGESWQDADSYNEMIGNDVVDTIDSSMPEGGVTDPFDPGTFDNTDHSADWEDGNDSTGNSTDTEHLQDIVDNTNTMNENLKTQGEILQEISEKVGAIGDISYSGTISVDTPEVTVEGGATAEEIAEELIGDGTGTDVSFDGTALDNAQQGAEDAFDTTNDLAVDAPLEYQQKTDLEDKIDEIETNSTVQGIKDIFTDSSVSAVGSPCFTYNYKGSNIDFCVDVADSALNTWGALMMSLVTLHALLIVFRRR